MCVGSSALFCFWEAASGQCSVSLTPYLGPSQRGRDAGRGGRGMFLHERGNLGACYATLLEKPQELYPEGGIELEKMIRKRNGQERDWRNGQITNAGMERRC